MRNRILVTALTLALLTTPMLAQQAPQRAASPAELQGIAEALSQQAETSRTLHIQASARAAAAQIEVKRLADENAKLKAEIEALKKADAK